MAEMRLGNYRMDRGGIREIFTSGEMQAFVAEVTGTLAAKANDDASEHHVWHEPLELPAYEGVTKVGHSTAMGVVRPVGPDGFLDQHIYHTLDGLNH